MLVTGYLTSSTLEAPMHEGAEKLCKLREQTRLKHPEMLADGVPVFLGAVDYSCEPELNTQRAKILEKIKNIQTINKYIGKTHPHSGEQVYLGQDSKNTKQDSNPDSNSLLLSPDLLFSFVQPFAMVKFHASLFLISIYFYAGYLFSLVLVSSA